MSEDLYTILGISKDASEDDIRHAYRKLAREHHPDLNPGDAAAEDRFKTISAAYEVLSKPEKRALYDELGADAETIGYDPERAEAYREWKRRAEAAQGFGDRATGYADIEDLLGDLFRGRGPRRGADLEASLQVSFEDAVRGTTTSLTIGHIDGGPLRVKIPAGIESGQRLRLEGKGASGREGGPPGDLYVRIEVQPHAIFTRDGPDLHLTLPVTVPEALVGATVEVPTLGGGVKLKVPAGAVNGQKMRLRGKGVGRAKGDPGDLYVTLEVVMPTGGDAEARAAVAEQLAALYGEQDVRGGLR